MKPRTRGGKEWGSYVWLLPNDWKALADSTPEKANVFRPEGRYLPVKIDANHQLIYRRMAKFNSHESVRYSEFL